MEIFGIVAPRSSSLVQALRGLPLQTSGLEMCLQQRLQRLLVFKRNTFEITTTAGSTTLSTKKAVVEPFPLKDFLPMEHLYSGLRCANSVMTAHTQAILVPPRLRPSLAVRFGGPRCENTSETTFRLVMFASGTYITWENHRVC